MLTGTITVKKAYANYVDQSTVTQDVISLDRDLTYEFKGIDSSTCLYGELTTNDYDAIRYMASSTDDQDEMWVRRFDLNLNSIKPEREQWKDENGKTVKSAVNFDFFCMLGATIRYAKYRCRPECAVGYTGLQSASGEFTPESETEYIITSESANEADRLNLGTVRLKLGEFMSIHIETPVFSISVDEDPRMEIEVFSTIKNCQPKGFQFEEDYLGFKVDIYSGLAEANTDGMYTSLEDIIKNNPDREFSWLLGKKYIIVDDAMLDDVVKYFEDVPDNERIYFDTETSGLQITFRSRLGQDDQCVGIILSYEDGVSYFFPMQMRSIPNLCNGDHFYFMEHYMRHILENKRLVAHNMSFDWKVAYIYDINANIVDDTMALFNLTLGNEKENFPSGLKSLTHLILHRDSLELSDLVASDSWGENDIRFWDLPKELVRLYACADTDNTRGLMQYAIQNDLLHRYNATKVYEIEIAFSYAVAYQEFYGHKIDVDNLDVLHKELDEGLSSNMAKMEEIVGYEFNPNSSKQLQRIMYTELGIPEQISRKTGRVTTDKETLKALSEITDLEGNPKYPFVAYLQKYREFEGIRKIVDKFPELSTPDGYIFSEVQQYGTTTGRVSVKKPNYQSYNDPVKKNVVPRPGFYMTDTDYSSVEYRVLGNIVGNKKIKEGFVDPDFDYHQYQAARMYGVPYASVTSKLRKAAKGINFGLPYGMGDQSLGVRVFGEESKENTLKAAALRAKYFEGQEDVKEFFDTTRAGGVANGYTETFFGRRRYYHRNKFSVAAIRRQAGNAVIQGCLGGDTLIETRDFGIVPISEAVGYMGDVWNGTKWTHGDVLYSGKKQKCIIELENGQEFICSPIHKFLVGEDPKSLASYVECKDLKQGTYIKTNKGSDLKVHSSDAVDSIKVAKVTITDEYLDMYDVCNTDEGYYVADGLITHNTAADVYKLAVGRLFLRICKEGWLGKVLFTGFIHDEVLCEVHCSIDPMKWLKVLREEFEVKIKGWCPLYMGFGFGMSWYEAKKTELPIQLQWELVEKYGETGYPKWHGDGKELCAEIPDMLRDFSIRHAEASLKDPAYQGKEIKPATNKLVIDIIAEDAGYYNKIVPDALKTVLPDYDVSVESIDTSVLGDRAEEIVSGINEKLRAEHIDGVLYAENGELITQLSKLKETQAAIDLYCRLHSVDRSLIDVKSLAEGTVNADAPAGLSDVAGFSGGEDDETDMQALADSRVEAFGMFLDTDESRVILKMLPPQYMEFIRQRCNKEQNGYRIRFKDTANRMFYDTECYLPSEEVPTIQSMYIQYFKQTAGSTGK